MLERVKLLPPVGQFFSYLKPMEPKARSIPFDSSHHYFQIKWDGVRMLAFLEKGRIELQNRKGRRRTDQYPELQLLKDLIKAKDALFDGEVVVMQGGKPSFPSVIQRDFLTREQSIKSLSGRLPVTYCIFDLLYLNGEDLTPLPLTERLEMLAAIAATAGPLYLNENFDSGTALYRQVDRLELEGIVAKEKNSPYLFGHKSDYWLKIKPRRKLLCVVGGVTTKNGAVGALLLGAWRGAELLYIGRAGSGLTRQDLLDLRKYAQSYAAPDPPFANPPSGEGKLWFEPRLTVNIEYAEWTPDLRLRAPVVSNFSSLPPEDATI